MKPDKVLVFGGTHGNEWTGVYAVKQFGETLKQEFSSLNLEFIHANPEAFKSNRRFNHEDLNRAFQFLQENRPDSYEHRRAKELLAMVDEKSFIVDLHTTTSNMGNTVIITREHPLNFLIASHLAKKLKDTRIIFSPDPTRKYLTSQSDFGMMIEVGPVANSLLNRIVLENTLELLREILNSLSTLVNLTAGSIEIYEEVEDVYYPLNEKGEMMASIHPEFEGKDFLPLNGDYSPFLTFTGEAIKMSTQDTMYPIFINEAAYYPTKLAFTLCRKRILTY